MGKWLKIKLKKLFGLASHEEKVRLHCHNCNYNDHCAYTADTHYGSIKNAEIGCDLENL